MTHFFLSLQPQLSLTEAPLRMGVPKKTGLPLSSAPSQGFFTRWSRLPAFLIPSNSKSEKLNFWEAQPRDWRLSSFVSQRVYPNYNRREYWGPCHPHPGSLIGQRFHTRKIKPRNRRLLSHPEPKVMTETSQGRGSP